MANLSAKSELDALVTDAYEHLYDLSRLGDHALRYWLVPDDTLRRKEKVWQLQRVLLDAIDELSPGPKAPVFSREWRRHRLMVLRYVDGLDPQAVADQIAVSRRQYYREHEAAIQAVVKVLTDQFGAFVAVPKAAPASENPPRLQLLRAEAAGMIRTGQASRLNEVIPSALTVLRDMLRQHRLDVLLNLGETLPGVGVNPVLLRQIVLAIMGLLIDEFGNAKVHIGARLCEAGLTLSIAVDPSEGFERLSRAAPSGVGERLAAVQEMVALASALVTPLKFAGAALGYELQLPVCVQRTILVVDDNNDVLELVTRYLGMHNYSVITARTAQEGLALARQARPYAVVLDLMMPECDGWDLLQVLLNQPDTRHVPVVVCSVLRQRELALSLGATAYLEKPVSEQALLAALSGFDMPQEASASLPTSPSLSG